MDCISSIIKSSRTYQALAAYFERFRFSGTVLPALPTDSVFVVVVDDGDILVRSLNWFCDLRIDDETKRSWQTARKETRMETAADKGFVRKRKNERTVDVSSKSVRPS